MRRRLIALSLAALAVPLAAPALADEAVPAAQVKLSKAEQKLRKNANKEFERLAKRYVGNAPRLNPVEATALGDHRYDSLLPDITSLGRTLRAAEWSAILTGLLILDRSRLTRDNQVDCAMLENELRLRLWTMDKSQEWAWNPQYYNDIAAGSLYSLAARDFAPWNTRLKAATLRMEALPAFLAESRQQLVAARVPKIHAETVVRQNAGIIEVAEGLLAPQAGKLSGKSRRRFDAALVRLKQAVEEHQVWLDKWLLPRAKGDFRLGAAMYDEKMKLGLMSNITRPALKARALKARADTRAEMYALSRQVLAGRAGAPPLPALPNPAQQQAGIEAALKLSYAKRPPREQLEQRARETLATATAFVTAKGFIRMPRGPVKVITMPQFQQGNSVAYNDPPGAFEKGQANFYAVSPIPVDWSDAQAESFLSEYNDYMIHDLSIHEAMPGHYLQLDHANESKRKLRAMLWSGPFVEGWAVYAEGVMKDAGYLDGDPLFQLTVLKMRLRSVTNTLLDIGVHTEGMTREQAMELMTKGAFQQEREASGKWVRAQLSSVQLLSYFTGYEEHRELRAEAERRWGPQFTLRTYHDTVLSFGSPPTKYVRSLMFTLPVD